MLNASYAEMVEKNFAKFTKLAAVPDSLSPMKVLSRGYSVMYETASRLFSKLEQAKFGGSEESRADANKYTECDLLILDDLGTEMPGQFVTAALYSLVNDRLMSGKPMVISTNLNVDELGRRYSPQIASRLYGSFSRLIFVGDDIRVMKNRRM
jgi:DNA replication protein DnaC